MQAADNFLEFKRLPREGGLKPPRVIEVGEVNSTRQPQRRLYQRFHGRRGSFSVTNASQIEAKLTYVRLNIQTPCPPRGAVPVNTRAC